MNKQISLSNLEDELSQVRTKKKEFLEQIERIVPWNEWVAMIKPCYYKGERGNKPYELELMLRLYLIQNLYNLADEATAYSKRADPEKGNDSRFNYNSSSDFHEKQGTQT